MNVRSQTISLAILYALKSNKNIYVNVISSVNFQPFVLDDNETMKDILDYGYRNQAILYNGNEFCIDRTSENNWRALNVYYAVRLNLDDYTILDSSSSPVIKLKDSALRNLAYTISNFSQDELEKIYRAIVNKALSKMSGLSAFKTATIKIDIENYRKILIETNNRLNRKYSGELHDIRNTVKKLDEMMFKKYDEERQWHMENDATIYFENLAKEKAKRKEAKRKLKEKKQREEDKRQRALERERKREERKQKEYVRKYKKTNGIRPPGYDDVELSDSSSDSSSDSNSSSSEYNPFLALLYSK